MLALTRELVSSHKNHFFSFEATKHQIISNNTSIITSFNQQPSTPKTPTVDLSEKGESISMARQCQLACS